MPASIRDAGLENEFQRNHRRRPTTLIPKLRETGGSAADYVLTNSHRRRVLMKMNLREMYHFVRLRDDEHAQWDIRQLAHQLAEKIKNAHAARPP